MNKAEKKFEKRFQESRLQYIKSLSGKISEIKLIWNQLNSSGWRIEVILKMRNMVHNLAGSGGTFELHKLSQQSKLLEQALDSLRVDNQISPDELSISKINDLLISIQEAGLQTIQHYQITLNNLAKDGLIYILDSDKSSSLIISKQLMYFGCSVRIITDTPALISDLQSQIPILIIIADDFSKLIIDNYNVIQTLRNELELTCPVIYISNRDSFEDRAAAIKATASAYFTKPIDISLLLERIHILTNAIITEPYRILLVEDDIELAKFYSLAMESKGMTVFIETQPELVVNKILEVNPELVVIDLYFPNYNGIELIKIIRQHQSLFALPIILLTVESDINIQFIARELGVDDVLHKPISEDHLFDSVLNRVQRSRYMNLSVTKDSLTGLFTHKKINEYLATNLELCKRYNTPLSYTTIDIDSFKDINDRYDHFTADNVLVTLSNLLKTDVRVTDFIGRYGSDEFVIISPETSAKDAFNTIERLREKFAAINHYYNDKVFHVTFSAGIASFPKFEDLEIMIVEADKALYKSKNNGSNQTTIS